MNADDAKQKQLVEALADNELIKAVVVIDPRGRVKARRGKALALRTLVDAETTTMLPAPGNPKTPPKESVYIARAASDFVVVFFDENTSFDALKHEVDRLLTQLELVPAEG
ncbi:MAG: hypothetical protein H0U74_06630 [Bradymonadaceae bacterium]|nr:hypothetical protein [Lujinxingiaceae bacterium]